MLIAVPCAFPPLYTQSKLISKVEKTCPRSKSVIDFRPCTSDNLNGIFLCISGVEDYARSLKDCIGSPWCVVFASLCEVFCLFLVSRG